MSEGTSHCLKHVHQALVVAWISGLLRKREAFIAASSLEDDGRKQAKALKELEAEGYIKREALDGGGHRITATDRAYKAVEETKPDFCIGLDGARDDDYALANIHGRPFDMMTLGERKYVLEHRDSVTFLVLTGMHDVRPWTDEDSTGYGRGDIIVQDAEFVAKKAARIKQIRFTKAYRQNLGWGLVELGFIEDVDADIFKDRKSVV